MTHMFRYRCPTCSHVWTDVNPEWGSEPCPRCDGDDVEPFESKPVPRALAENHLAYALASLRATADQWETGDLAGAVRSGAEVVADFERAVDEAPAEPDEETAAGLLAEINDTWGEQFADDDMIEGADFVEWVAEWMKRVRATLAGGKKVEPPPVVVEIKGGMVQAVYGPEVHVVVVDWDLMPGEQAGTVSVQPSSEMDKETAEVVARALTEEGVQP
jgi:hypothetical protein